MHTIKLYWHPLSGHAHRAQLFLSLLGLPTELVPVDLASQDQKKPSFLEMNAFGQIPVLDDAGVILADSSAILVYLAKKYAPARWLPEDAVGAARVQRWLSVAAGPLAFGPALARVRNVFRREMDPAPLIERSKALLSVMNKELSSSDFLAGPSATIADVALFTYVEHAPEGGVSLDEYPAVRAWLGRIRALPGFVPMQATPVGLAG